MGGRNTPGGQERCGKWRSVFCADGVVLCNGLAAAEEKSACLILKLSHTFNSRGSQIPVLAALHPAEIANWVESCSQGGSHWNLP